LFVVYRVCLVNNDSEIHYAVRRSQIWLYTNTFSLH